MVPTVTVPEVGPDAHLLDVREPDEWAAGHAPGAQHVPMYELPARLAMAGGGTPRSGAGGESLLPADRDVVVVCRSGIRSAQVVRFLLGNGYEKVYNLDGGMEAWAGAGRPMVSDTGAPAQVL
jgi:rhodanese-related sulfurtransferase